MSELLRVLIIDDLEADALLLQRALRKGGLEIDSIRVDTAEAMRSAIATQRWDVAISDCHMPEFTPEGALAIWQETGQDQPFIVASGAIGEEEAVALLKAGAHDFVRKDNLARLVTAIERELRETAERRARREAEEALRDSEERRLRLRAELACAAEVQRQLLPQNYPTAAGFEFAARCLPAHQIGGDFYDWHEMATGTVTLTLGDVMGKGMAAAMLMATVRAALRAVDQTNSPAVALQLTECALIHDLANSDSFVTLFHAQLNLASRKLVYVDCGHGFVFLRRSDGRVEELLPRGLPLGVLSDEIYQEGEFTFEEGDTLVVYSDGLIDAMPEQSLDNDALADVLDGAMNVEEMVERLTGLVPSDDTIPDDLTVVVVHCVKEN
jgi:sigma-B regulation protein RsbU (phosphoserine phosphatase)